MDVESDDLEAACRDYAAELPELFIDLVHLGLGPDGHCASLIPGDPVSTVTDRLVATGRAVSRHPAHDLTYPALAASESALWLVERRGQARRPRQTARERPVDSRRSRRGRFVARPGRSRRRRPMTIKYLTNKGKIVTSSPDSTPVNSRPRPDNHVIVIFGITGDLARRKILPGLYHLAVAGLLPERTASWAVVARRPR